MLVLRVAAEIRSDEILNNLWYPLIMGEESYEVASAGEFWLSTLFKLGRQEPQGQWSEIYDELLKEPDDQRLGSLALARLMEFSEEIGKRILLVVENLNMILGDQLNDDDAWNLRHTLQNEPRLMLLGSATSRFDEIDCQGKAMYELFRLHELEPLNEKDCNRVWRLITQREARGKEVRPIQILTGGNLRLLTILCSFIRKNSLNNLLEELAELIDDHTDYFKSNIEALSRQERKVFVTLAGLWDPSTAQEIAKVARLNVNLISSVLNRLEGRGAVQVIDKVGRKKLYQVTERLYNIFYLMRRHGGRFGRVRAAIRFMITFYNEEDLVDAFAHIAEEACKLELNTRKEHLAAYEICVTEEVRENLQKRIIKATDQEYFTLSGVSPRIAGLNEKYRKSSDVENEEKRLQLVLKKQPENSQAWAELGKLLEETGERFDEAETAYRQAVKVRPDYAWAWTRLGCLLEEKYERFEEAETAYRQAIEVQPDYAWAWTRLGHLLEERFERFEEAEVAYNHVIKIQPDDAWAWTRLGMLQQNRYERFDEAEAAYRRAINIQPTDVWPWIQLSILQHEKGEHEVERESSLTKATELEPDNSFAAKWLLGMKLDRKADTSSIFKTANLFIEASGHSPESLDIVAKVFYKKGDSEWLSHAETFAREASKNKPDNWLFAHTLVSILGAGGEWIEALEIAQPFLSNRKAIGDILSETIEFFIAAAAAGYAAKVLDILRGTAAAEVLEPLVVGLRLLSGEKVQVAKEILEVGKDVEKRIRSRTSMNEGD